MINLCKEMLIGVTSADRLREAAGAQCALLHRPFQPRRLQETFAAVLSIDRGLKR